MLKFPYVIRPATEWDARYIAQNLRDSDRDEVIASSGPDYEESIVLSYKRSDECFVAEADGVPFCIYGIGKDDFGGIPWMLATPTIVRFRKQLLRTAPRVVARWMRRYGALFNYVDARNEVSIRWLKRLGFTITPAQPFGVEGRPFHFFFLKRNVS